MTVMELPRPGRPERARLFPDQAEAVTRLARHLRRAGTRALSRLPQLASRVVAWQEVPGTAAASSAFSVINSVGRSALARGDAPGQ
ncbi:hypothetical protein ACWEWK_29335 [Streptomyces sp. NPDC003757]